MAAFAFDASSVRPDAGRLSTPTEYRGTRFMSRLEARWAVFFDYCYVRWRYEPSLLYSGHRYDITMYVPDFSLDTENEFLFAEVKPSIELISDLEWEKMELAGPRMVILDGPPENRTYQRMNGSELDLRDLCRSGEGWLVEEAIVYSNKYKFR